MIEITRFALAAEADESEFRRADKALQEDFAYQQPGLLRRTTARSRRDSWIVIDRWRSHEDADACAAKWDGDPVVQRFLRFVDRESLRSERFDERD